MEFSSRNSTSGLQFRRGSRMLSPPRTLAPSTPALITAPAAPSIQPPTPAIQPAAPQSSQPVKTIRKKPATSRLRFDPALPEHDRLLLLLEHGLPLHFASDATDLPALNTSLQALLAHVRAHPLPPKRRHNPANTSLQQREAQLMAVVATYERELKQWREVVNDAPMAPISVVEVPEEKKVQLGAVDEVLERSTKAVEEYVLQTDHLRTMLKRLESRNRRTDGRIREIAATLNDRVVGGMGGDIEELKPPGMLAAVKTADLTSSAMKSR